MSLKNFHLIFIAVSTLLAIGFGVWWFRAFTVSGDIGDLIMGISSCIVGFGLIVYGVRFRRKIRERGIA